MVNIALNDHHLCTIVCGSVFQVIDIIRVCIEILEKIVSIELFPDIMYPRILCIPQYSPFRKSAEGL